MSTTPKVDISLIRGDTSQIDFELTENGDPIDLTDSTVFFTAKPTIDNDASDATAVIAVKVTTHIAPTEGKTVIPLSATDTDVAPGEYLYDIQVKRQDATIVSIPFRKLEVIGDVTRRTA